MRSDPSGETTVCVFNMSDADQDVAVAVAGRLRRILSTCEARFGGDPSLVPAEAIDVPEGGAAQIACAPWSATIYARSTT